MLPPLPGDKRFVPETPNISFIKDKDTESKENASPALSLNSSTASDWVRRI